MKNLSLILSILFLSSISLIAQSEEFGVASYYADAFDGRKTASGEVYNKSKMTAAHKELPFGTMIRVTRLDNKKSVVLRVNDRGPFISGRVVELSTSAAQKIGLIRDGIAEVKVEVVKERDLAKETLTTKAATKPAPQPKSVPKSYDNTPKTATVPESAKVVTQEKKAVAKPSPAPKKTTPKAAAKPASVKKEKLVQSASQDGLYKIQLIRPEKTGYGVQVAYLSDYESVFRQVADLQSDWFKNILVSVTGKGSETKYRIILGPFPDAKTAEAYKASLLKKKKRKGFVVDLSTL